MGKALTPLSLRALAEFKLLFFKYGFPDKEIYLRAHIIQQQGVFRCLGLFQLCYTLKLLRNISTFPYVLLETMEFEYDGNISCVRLSQ